MRNLTMIACACGIAFGCFALGQQSRVIPDISARAATKDSNNYVDLFVTVYEQVLTDYVDKVDERQLIESALKGMVGSLNEQSINLDIKQSKDSNKPRERFINAYKKMRSDYGDKVDERRLIEGAINGMLASLDPRSSYLDAKAFRDMQRSSDVHFSGLGLEVTQEGDFVKVVTPINDTPSSLAGVVPGDLIAAIDNVGVNNLSLNVAVDMMRGPINTPVRLTILRGAERRKIELKMVRDYINIASVRSRKQDDDIGYIRIPQFNEAATEGLKAAIVKFQQEIPADKFKGYILDLRNNPGGLLDQSIQVANAFIENGEIVTRRGRNADHTARCTARVGDLSNGKPVVVLINGGTGSGSEIVAGALQDNRRATIVGTRSVGIGTIQTIIPLGGASGALRLTTARWYTPSGRSIEAKGIEPDIVVLQDVPDEFKGKEEVKGEDGKTGLQGYVPPDEKKDKQLLAAIDLLRRTPSTRKTSEPTKSTAPN